MPDSTPGTSANAGPEIRTLLGLELLGVSSLHEQRSTVGPLPARHDHLVRDLLLRFDGREIEKSGRFLLLFERPIDAVRYGLAYHEAAAALAAELDLPFAGRIGIHLGEVFLRKNPPEHVRLGAKPLEVEGPSRTTTARVMSLAAGGQTLLTKAAFDLAQRAAVDVDDLAEDLVWQGHGRYRFAGTGEVLEVFEVGVDGVAPLRAPQPPIPEEPRRTGAVLPERAEGWRPAEGEPIPHRPHWALVRPLDEATYGEVWLGKHRKTGDRRAFRFCFDADEIPRMKHQLAVVRHLRENLGGLAVAPRTLDSQLDEVPYLLESEHVESDTLAAWADARGGPGAVSLRSRLEIVARLADIVSAVHRAGVAVGNLRPLNVLIRERPGSVPEILLADLSQARIVEAPIAVSEAPDEPPERDPTATFYLAPERDESRPVSPEGDVYALGILLYQLVAGDLGRPLGPFWERDVDDELLRREIAGLADPDPRARPVDAAAVAERLRNLEARRAELEAEGREPKPTPSEEGRRKRLLGGLLRRR